MTSRFGGGWSVHGVTEIGSVQISIAGGLWLIEAIVSDLIRFRIDFILVFLVKISQMRFYYHCLVWLRDYSKRTFACYFNAIRYRNSVDRGYKGIRKFKKTADVLCECPLRFRKSVCEELRPTIKKDKRVESSVNFLQKWYTHCKCTIIGIQ